MLGPALPNKSVDLSQVRLVSCCQKNASQGVFHFQVLIYTSLPFKLCCKWCPVCRVAAQIDIDPLSSENSCQNQNGEMTSIAGLRYVGSWAEPFVSLRWVTGQTARLSGQLLPIRSPLTMYENLHPLQIGQRTTRISDLFMRLGSLWHTSAGP